jgi:hypothetical protein
MKSFTIASIDRLSFLDTFKGFLSFSMSTFNSATDASFHSASLSRPGTVRRPNQICSEVNWHSSTFCKEIPEFTTEQGNKSYWKISHCLSNHEKTANYCWDPKRSWSNALCFCCRTKFASLQKILPASCFAPPRVLR